ncbi:MAG: GlsB/YeaQ/YmgE family stress response membrane protein [Planctomycetaceae bacterium]|nr:MAG: GlsB/YeaQ/YmgE family stress response membrane protein [Planctomycetaceae bacterium]
MLDFVWFIVIGIAAGWLAGQIMKAGNAGTVAYLIVGVIGALVGGIVLGLLGLTTTNLIGRLVSATVGACLLIAGLRYVRRNRI